MSNSVFGIVTNEAHLRDLLARLSSLGFHRDDRSVVFPDAHSAHPIAYEKGSKAPEGAVAGGLTGAGLGGVLGLLAGIGALAIPGVGPLIAAGPLLALLSGAAVGAAAGSLTGSLIGLGIPEYEAKRYAGHLKDGSILVAVHAEDSDWESKALGAFKDAQAVDVAIIKDTTVRPARAGSDTTTAMLREQQQSTGLNGG